MKYTVTIELKSGGHVPYLLDAENPTDARHRILELLPEGSTVVAVSGTQAKELRHMQEDAPIRRRAPRGSVRTGGRKRQSAQPES